MPHRRPVLRKRQKDRWIVRGQSRSLTGHVVESLATGVVADVGPERQEPEIPGPEARLIRMGDPDVSALQNEYSGDESPGASNPTPDQNLIDATGRALGIENADGGALRTSSELLDDRDGEAAATKPRERQRLVTERAPRRRSRSRR
jgi:hypothetical protein